MQVGVEDGMDKTGERKLENKCLLKGPSVPAVEMRVTGLKVFMLTMYLELQGLIYYDVSLS